jgi:hypothetical protein
MFVNVRLDGAARKSRDKPGRTTGEGQARKRTKPREKKRAAGRLRGRSIGVIVGFACDGRFKACA